MRKFVASGFGHNIKTGKLITFRIPESISVKGLEGLDKNLLVDSFVHGDKRFDPGDRETWEFVFYLLKILPATPERKSLQERISDRMYVLEQTEEEGARLMFERARRKPGFSFLDEPGFIEELLAKDDKKTKGN